jgi:hypothetical protein
VKSEIRFSSSWLLALLISACSSSSAQPGDGGASPSPSKSIAAASGSELGALCDELAATEGGYSHQKMLSCDAGTETLSFQIGTTQTQCKQLLAALGGSCPALTVGEVQDCVKDTYAETCASASAIPVSCEPFFLCLAGDGSAQ